MARNRRYAEGSPLPLAVPDGTKSGDPVVIGALAGVALEDKGESQAGIAACQCGGVYDFSVVGKNKAGEKAIAEGDVVYMMADKTINVNNEEGKRFGVALKPVVKNKTEVIPVRVGY